MRQFRIGTRTLILSLLSLSVFIPIFFLSNRLKNLNSQVSNEFVVEDLSVIKHRTEDQAFSAVEEEESVVLKEPFSEVYKDIGFNSGDSLSSPERINRTREPGNAVDDPNLLGRDVGFISGVSLGSSDQTFRIREPGNAADDVNTLERDVGSNSGVNLSSSDETNRTREPGNADAADDANSSERDVVSNSGFSLGSSDDTNRTREPGNATDDTNLLTRDGGFNSVVRLVSSNETNRVRETGNADAADDANLSERDVVSNSGLSLGSSNETNRTREPGNAVDDTNLLKRDGGFNSVVRLVSSNETNRISEPGNAADDSHLLERNGTNDDKRGDTNKKEDNLHTQKEEKLSLSEQKYQFKPTQAARDHGLKPQPRRALDEKVKQMFGQIIRAKAYLQLLPPSSRSRLAKELRSRMKAVEQALGHSTKDSDLPRRALQKMTALEASLSKASRIYPRCTALDTELRAMTYNAEEQVQVQKDQTAFLLQLVGRTTPKGLHCLSMRLTFEFFALHPEDRELPNQHKLHDPALYHFAVFSDNILAGAVVVNSTVSNARDSEAIVFHIVTDSLNVPAMTMWFLLNPPGKAAVEIQSIDNFGWLSVKYDANLQKQDSTDLRFTSPLNHLRFYLPDIFPRLNKIVLLDHDVVVQRDLTGLWEVNLKGKVNGAVETCQKDEPSFRQMDLFINFTNPIIAKSFDVNTCTWAFGINIFNLQEWRGQDLSGVYHKYLQLGNRGPVMKAGSLPIGWMTFYNQTVALDRTWHVLGLGYDSGVKVREIEQAAVIHFDGIMKPWLDIGLVKYKPYWKKYVNYQHPYLKQCNMIESET